GPAGEVESRQTKMCAAGARGPRTPHPPPPTQNSHQIGPRIRPNPPTTNAAMMRLTATQDTTRPWYGFGADSSAVTGLSWPPSAECPVTMPEPSWSAMPAAPLRGARGPPPLPGRAAPAVPPAAAPPAAITLLWRSQLSSVRPAPKARHHRPARLRLLEDATPGTKRHRRPLPGWRAKGKRPRSDHRQTIRKERDEKCQSSSI